jgi:hypothetical protein
MPHGINAAVAANVPICAKAVSPAVYFMAIRCQSYEEAYNKWLRKIEHLLPIPLVRPWKRVEKNQSKVLHTTSQYSQGNTDPADYGYRATEAARSVSQFSEGAYKPERMGKISPRKAAPHRIPAEYVCNGCGGDVRTAWAMLEGDVLGYRRGHIVQTTDHSKCMDQRVDASVLGPKAGMFRKK